MARREDMRRLLLFRHIIATMIQANVRKSLATLKFKKSREKATTIQSVVRGYRDRVDLSRKHTAATPVAALARGHLTRKRSRQKILVRQAKQTACQNNGRCNFAML